MESHIEMSFRANAVSRGIFPSGKFYLVMVHYPTWWIPPLRFAPVGMTIQGYVSTDSPTVPAMFYAAPRPLSHQTRPQGEPASPEGSFCTVLLGGIIQPYGFYLPRPRNGTQAVPYGFAGGWYRLTAQVVYATWRAADCRPYNTFVPYYRIFDVSIPVLCSE